MERALPALSEADLRRPWREAAWVLAYGVSWCLGYYVSTHYWFLPAGLRFACLWYAPRRLWSWLALSEFAAIVLVVLQADGYRTWSGFALGVLAPWLVHASVVLVALRKPADRIPDTPWRMARLLLAMLAAASLTAGVLTVMGRIEGNAQFADPLLQMLSFAVGDFVAMLIVVPIWLQLGGAARWRHPRLFLDVLLWFLPLLAIVTLWPALRPHAALYAALLALVPMVFMVFRHGWQGGGWTLAATSVAVYVLGSTLAEPATRELMQLFLAIVGAVTLMLGASVTALRRARDALSDRNAALAAQAMELRALSARLVRAQEDEQRRIAQEMQGELEQGMTALGTRLGLLARTPLEPAQMAAVDSLRGLTQDIHASMRDVLMHLRPVALDRHGLDHALRAGPVRDLVTDAGLHYQVRIDGDTTGLDPDVQAALYRICQEAATDCVRRRRASQFEVYLAVAPHGEALQVRLQVGYEVEAAGPQRSAAAAEDHALPGTRDRVQALGGDYACRHAGHAVEHRVHFVAARR